MESVFGYKSVWCHRSQDSTTWTLSKWRMTSSFFPVLLFSTWMLESQEHMLALVEELVTHPYTRHWEPYVLSAKVFFHQKPRDPLERTKTAFCHPSCYCAFLSTHLPGWTKHVISLPLFLSTSTQNIVDPASRGQPSPLLLPSLPSLPPSLFIAEASLLAWIVLWHCWTFFPYRTFLWFLGFLLPCWLLHSVFPIDSFLYALKTL